jgi:hypothetical protein
LIAAVGESLAFAVLCGWMKRKCTASSGDGLRSTPSGTTYRTRFPTGSPHRLTKGLVAHGLLAGSATPQ